MADLKLPPKLSLKKSPSDAPVPVAVAAPAAVPNPAPAQAAPAPQPVAVATPATQPKPIIAAPKLTPKAPAGMAAPVAAKPVAATLPGIKPATTPPGTSGIGIKKPVPMGIKPVAAAKPIPVAAAKPVSVAAAVAAQPAPTADKRQTSRVELGTATKTNSGSLEVSDLDPVSAKDASKPDAKRMTAKISLDAVLAAPDPDADSGPKTIRLKRPGETSSPIKASPIKPKTETAAVDADDDAAPARSASTDAAGGEGENGAPKRTIRVKRPGSAESTTSASKPVASVDVQLEDLSPEESTHWAFVLCGVAAVLVAAVNLYVVLAGVMGLPWVGSIS